MGAKNWFEPNLKIYFLTNHKAAQEEGNSSSTHKMYADSMLFPPNIVESTNSLDSFVIPYHFLHSYIPKKFGFSVRSTLCVARVMH